MKSEEWKITLIFCSNCRQRWHCRMVLKIKTDSSQWMGRKFSWQRGFGAFSVSASKLQAVTRYIRNQDEPHKRMNFDEEFLALLKKHGVAFDPKYVFG